MRHSRLLAALMLAIVGLVLTLYGLFALTFREGDGTTYVMIGGRHADARLVGAISVFVGLSAILCAAVFARRT
jgi:hypothetical protein